MQNTDHSKYVHAWLDQAAKDVPAESLPILFEKAWGALWRRAASAVGEIVLESVGELIRSNSVDKYPFLAPLRLESAEISAKALAESSGTLERRELQEGIRFMLVEFITVIGDLTDQILTPGLYAELSRISPQSKMPHSHKQEKSPHESRIVKEKEKEKEETTMTAKQHPIATNGQRMTAKGHSISTGIRNFDEMLTGGLIPGSSTAIAGPPGSGKTILAQQIAFHNATEKNPVLYFSTLSEPGAKTLFYLNKFSFFDPKKIGSSVHFVDLGVLVRAQGLPQTLELIMERVRKIKPTIVVVDSFKVFEDMAQSPEELRKFSYELVIKLMTRKCTSLFLGEYAPADFERNPLFSIIDGIVSMTQRELSGEQQRFIQINKMRGLAHSRDEYTFKITPDGIEIFAPRLTIQRSPREEAGKEDKTPRCKVGIGKFDDLLGGGIPRGSSLLIAGVAGTGKTVLGLEFVYRGALAGEKGVVFSFEETEARLRAAARGLGWDLDAQIDKGMVEIVFIPQPDIMVEHHLLMMQEKIAAMKAQRVTVDSLSVFLHKTTDPQIAREKVFQLATIVQNTDAVGFFATDIPYGASQISRFGVEETVIDGVIILSASEEGLERQRYLEVYKMRNTAHLKGRHTMTIDTGGIQIFPRYRPQETYISLPPPSKAAHRLSTGVAGLDTLMGSGLMARSMTLVSGSSGIGKTMIAIQFLLEGAAKREHGLFVSTEEGPEELEANAKALGLPLRKALEDGLVEIVYLPPTHVRSTQFLAVLTDRINKQKTKRLVLDSTTHIVASGLSRDDVREMLYDVVVRFKELEVTSLFTLESDLMYSTDSSTDTYRGFAPLADNVIVLRYAANMNKLMSTLMVVKTRGSAHDNGLYMLTDGKGGLKIGASLTVPGPTHDVSGPTGDEQAQGADTGRRH